MSPIVEQPGLRVGIDGPDRVHDDGDPAPAGEQSFHRSPDAVVGGHPIDDEGRLGLARIGRSARRHPAG